jgi:integrase/recombinase XerD
VDVEYSDDEIASLMAQARRLTPGLRAATYETVIGLLAVTGMRPGEVLRLDRSDVDLRAGVLHVSDSKFHDPRQLPLHPSTVKTLAGYCQLRDQLCPKPTGPAFFVSAAGTRLRHGVLNQTFSRLRRAAGLQPPPGSGRPAPRPHDFRHTFAVRAVLDWYRCGADLDARLPSLSTYLGHRDPAGTYWYLSSTPELLAHAARRVESGRGAQP